MTITLEEFQNIIGVRFQDLQLLEQALTHRSYLNERGDDSLRDNERLEFLGDAILDFLVADLLFRQHPDMDEGHLTRLRAGMVRTESLGALAQTCQIGDALLMGKGEEKSGGRERLHTLCNAFEALVGAMYLDRGIETVISFALPLLASIQQDAMDEAINKDPRSQFQEWAQATRNITPHYQTVDSTGPDHAKEFTVEVLLDGKAIARGVGGSKRLAAQAAAQAALVRIETDEVLP